MKELIERFAAISELMQKLELDLIAVSGALYGKLAGGQNTLFEIGVLKDIDCIYKDIFKALRELLIYEVNKVRGKQTPCNCKLRKSTAFLCKQYLRY